MWKVLKNVKRLNLEYSVRFMMYYEVKPEKLPEKLKSLKERLEEMNYKDPELHFKVNIGLPPPKSESRSLMRKRLKQIEANKRDRDLEKKARTLTLEVDLDEVAKEWFKESGPKSIFTVAEHYGIFNDLFGDAYFIPYKHLEIGYPLPNQLEAPVHRGNVVKPAEALLPPSVRFESEGDNTLWTLILTNPDGHLTEVNGEYVHWFIGNIPGNDLSKGEVVWDYLQPFPPRGVGFQRFVFILYKQDKKIDYSSLKNTLPRLELKDRTFNTLEFYRERQDYLTPAGLAFFQSDWDHSVIKTYHETLNMEEPVFEYDHDIPYVNPEKWFPKKQPFNLYLDKYRDPRDIAKQYLLEKVENLDPFESPKKTKFPYPNIHSLDINDPTWLKVLKKRNRTGRGRIADQEEEEYE